MIGFECGRTGPLNEVGGEPYQPIEMAEPGSVDGLPSMVIARKVSQEGEGRPTQELAKGRPTLV